MHVIFLSRGVIFTTNHFFQVTQENSQPEQQPPSSAADQERVTRGRTTRSNSAAQNKGVNSGAVYTTTKQLRENAARKRSALSKKNTQVLCQTFYLSLHFKGTCSPFGEVHRYSFVLLLNLSGLVTSC